MKILKAIIIFIAVIILATILTIVTMASYYGCASPKYILVKEYNLSSFSCDKLKEAITTDTFLIRNIHNYKCSEKDNMEYVYYNLPEIREEYQNRCLNDEKTSGTD